MRTTLELDDTVMAAARAIARDEGRSVGAVISALALKGMQQQAVIRPGFPVFEADPSAVPITLDLVNEHRDE